MYMTLTITALTAITAALPHLQERQDASYQDTVLSAHNVHRSNHSANALTWDNDAASAAQDAANTCTFGHVQQGYGQNIAYSSENDVAGQVHNLWYNNEMPLFANDYGQENPSDGDYTVWGHFTQVVWKGTTGIGCATVDCTASLGGYYTVCNYNPPGNYDGEYADNVGEPLGQPVVS